MSADAPSTSIAELCARLRAAALDLAPDETPDETADETPGDPGPAPDDDAWKRASTEAAGLVAALEAGDDPLRVLLAADMALAIDDGARSEGRNRGRLVSLLDQSIAVLAGSPPGPEVVGVLPSCTPLAIANELRATRGAPLLSGNQVFALAVDARPPGADGDARDSFNPRLVASCRRLRSYYQQGLVAWLRDAKYTAAAAGRIGEVFARLHSLGHGGPQETLWRAAASFARLLEDPRWRVSAAVKRLLGQLDAQMKRLCEAQGVVPEAPPALVRDLLFYVGEVHDVEATIALFPTRSALLAAFAAPARSHSDQPTAVLSLLNELLSISGQLMEALGPDESWLAKRSWLVERMLEVADGLGLLGAYHLRHRALEEIDLLRATPGSGDPPAGGWGTVAERLHVLGADLLGAAGLEPTAAVAEDTAGMPASGHIARRLEADLVHAERLIERLERGGRDAVEDADEAEDDAVSAWRRRLEALSGAASASAGAAGKEAHSAVGARSTVGEPSTQAVDPRLLDELTLLAGDIDGSRARLEQQVGAFLEGLEEMDTEIRALREVLDGLRMHADGLHASPPAAGAMDGSAGSGAASAVADLRARLERFAGGLATISELRDGIEGIAGDSRSILVHQARDNVTLAQRLMDFRLQPLDVPLDTLGQTVAGYAADAGKQAMVRPDGGGLRLEPEKMAALLTLVRHLLEDMVEACVESPRARVLAGQPPGCLVQIRVRRRGADLDMLLEADCAAPPEESIAAARDRLRALGGGLDVEPGSRHQCRLGLQVPLAPQVVTVLLVTVADEIVALPLAEVEAVLQLSGEELSAGDPPAVEHEGERWPLADARTVLGFSHAPERAPSARVSLVLASAGGERRALEVDAIGERVDVVMRSVVPQLRSIKGLAGAAILGDGRVVLLLELGELFRLRAARASVDLETIE